MSRASQEPETLFISVGLPTIAMGLYVRFSLAESPAKASFLSPAEKAWLQQRHAESKVVLAWLLIVLL